ncbi:MAG: DsbC family protein [Burkholderiales bacterium]|nr:DsbC family protein [Burkholderiales bacterium]MDE2275854.1 DsbC family protein [Burkholderiales bacterium]
MRSASRLSAAACLTLGLALAALLAGAPARAQAPGPVQTQETAIRKALVARLPQLPKIDEITRSPIPGLYEVRYGGTNFLYSDDTGDFIVVNGSMVDTKTRTDLTDAKLQKLLAIHFDQLPFKDAMTFRQGAGTRRMAVFVDPNCTYCKHFERELATLKDVTIYAFMIPILGPDSVTKAHDIWCAKDPAQVWRSWMLDGVPPPRVSGRCDTAAIDRNLEFAQRQRIDGTPSLFFADGARRPGAIPREEVERLLAAAAAAPRR